MKIFILTIYLILNLPFFCNSQEKQKLRKHKKAVELSDKAVLVFQSYSYDSDSLKKAIILLDEAIKLDPTFSLPYTNKVAILCELGFYYDVLSTLNKIAKIKKDDPKVIMQQGHILEKMGNISGAMGKYRAADNLYNKLDKANPNLIQNKIGRAYLQLFLKGKEEGIKEFENITKYDNGQDVLQMKDFIYDFNRKEFINNYCSKPVPLFEEI